MAIVETIKTEKKEKKAPRAKASPASSGEVPKLQGFAVIETGGKQYLVSSGDVILTERFLENHTKGDTIVFDKVLLVSDGKDVSLGTPYLSGKTVEGTFEEEGRHKKISVIKFKSKVRYHRKYGHRQLFARI